MNRIEQIFNRLRSGRRTALMPFITAGYPSLDVTAEVIPELERSGASILELGFPFSDPIADGPVIAGSMHAALEAGVTPDLIFDLVRSLRDRTSLGLVAMVSDSIVRRIGDQEFLERAAEAGFDGLIVPDLDLDRCNSLVEGCRSRNLTLSLLVSQNSAPERLGRILERCSGFVYLLARAGITGERDAAPEIQKAVADLKARTDLPIAAGFGITTQEHVRTVTSHADAAIVGSALVRRMGSSEDPVGEAARLVNELSRGLVSG